MKNILIFIGGIVATLIVIILIYALSQPKSDAIMEGLTLFPEKGDCISNNQFKIFQVWAPNVALATEKKNELFIGGLIVLLINDEGKYYYDDEIIKIPQKKCARQIGTFRYQTINKEYEQYKTVPVISIE